MRVADPAGPLATVAADPAALFTLAGPPAASHCWLLSGTARLLAGPGAPAAVELTVRLAQRLTRAYLAASALPVTVRAAGRDFTLLAAGGRAGPAGWFLACAPDGGWPGELGEHATELAASLAFERARLDVARRAAREAGQRIVTALATGDPPVAAALPRVTGQPADGSYLAVALALDPPGGPDLAELAAELTGPLASPFLTGEHDGETFAVVPLAGRATLAASIRAAAPVLAAGLRGKLSVGISDPHPEGGRLAGALREARSARRLAGLRPGRVAVVTGTEAGTHAALLASVPSDVLSSFHDRLLGPLLRYDQQRGAGLVPTLAEFLACSGSWQACAARLYVHVNTLRYRIRRIEELTGRDLASLDHQVDFWLALETAGISAGHGLPGE